MTPQPDTPTELVRAAVAALDAARWEDVLPLVRPEALRRFRDVQWRGMVASEARPALREPEGLSPEECFVRYLAASSPAEKLRQAIAISPKPPADPEMAVESALRAGLGIVVLGEICEGERQAHVLYRQMHDETPYDPEAPTGHLQVTTLDHADGRWWLRIDHTLLDPQGWTTVLAPDVEIAPES